jgi:membrane protein implicated in regulation of membrane protease activity
MSIDPTGTTRERHLLACALYREGRQGREQQRAHRRVVSVTTAGTVVAVGVALWALTAWAWLFAVSAAALLQLVALVSLRRLVDDSRARDARRAQLQRELEALRP